MAFRVETTRQAEADIASAYTYIADSSRQAADRWLLRLRSRIASLSEMPGRLPLAPEATAIGCEIRQLFFGRRTGVYRILFRVDEHLPTPVVKVLAVRHGARSPLEPEDLDEE
jgi:plasmid stabilization system protein ParE